MGTSTESGPYPIFVSFSGADQEAFRKVFIKQVDRQFGGQVYYSERDPIMAGELDEQLRRRLDAARVLISIIGPNYQSSRWCKLELQHFLREERRQARRQNFIAICLSPEVFDGVAKWEAWRAAGLTENTVRIPFYLKDGSALRAYLQGEDAVAIENPGFLDRVEGICDHVRKRLELSSEPASSVASKVPDAPGLVVIGAVSTGLDVHASRLQEELASWAGPSGWTLSRLSVDDVASDDRDDSELGRRFAKSTLLILPFSDEPPLYPNLSGERGGGLVGYQNEWWERTRASRPDAAGGDVIYWKPAAIVAPERTATGKHRDFLNSLTANRGDAAEIAREVARRLSPRATGDASSFASVKIVIESNKHDEAVIEPLWTSIQSLWTTVVAHIPEARNLKLIHQDLSINKMRKFSSNLDADGIIVFWGSRDEEAVFMQTDNIDRDCPPANKFIAYLSPPNPNTLSEDHIRLNWAVVPFLVIDEHDGSVTEQVRVLRVLGRDYEEKMIEFLKKIARSKLPSMLRGRETKQVG